MTKRKKYEKWKNNWEKFEKSSGNDRKLLGKNWGNFYFSKFLDKIRIKEKKKFKKKNCKFDKITKITKIIKTKIDKNTHKIN